MTREEILAMPAGRKRDALVAEKVMGIKLPNIHNARFYSTDISAAWEVVEKMRDDNYKIVLEAKLHKGWYVYVKNDMGGNITGMFEFDTSVTEAISKISLIVYMEGSQ